MAFVQVTALPSRVARTATPAACSRPVMAANGVSRRAALRLAALGFATVAGMGAARAFDLEELKEDVEELKYEDEVTDVGPDSAEEIISRTKKPKPENPAIVQEKKQEEKEEEKYQSILAKEALESAELKKTFEKSRGFSK